MSPDPRSVQFVQQHTIPIMSYIYMWQDLTTNWRMCRLESTNGHQGQWYISRPFHPHNVARIPNLYSQPKWLCSRCVLHLSAEGGALGICFSRPRQYSPNCLFVVLQPGPTPSGNQDITTCWWQGKPCLDGAGTHRIPNIPEHFLLLENFISGLTCWR